MLSNLIETLRSVESSKLNLINRQSMLHIQVSLDGVQKYFEFKANIKKLLDVVGSLTYEQGQGEIVLLISFWVEGGKEPIVAAYGYPFSGLIINTLEEVYDKFKPLGEMLHIHVTYVKDLPTGTINASEESPDSGYME